MAETLQGRIEKLARYVAQSNGAMEATVRERQRDNPEFAFLFGGEGAAYYTECLQKFSGSGGGGGGGRGGSGGKLRLPGPDVRKASSSGKKYGAVPR